MNLNYRRIHTHETVAKPFHEGGSSSMIHDINNNIIDIHVDDINNFAAHKIMSFT